MTEGELRALIGRHPVKGDPPAMRKAFAALAAAGGAGTRFGVTVQETALGPLPALRLTPEAPKGPPVIHCHGGGYVFGRPETHLALGARLARAAAAEVFLPAYPLAPEAQWPAPKEALLAALAELEGPFVLSGDSAGGHLALSAALHGARPERLVLFSPNTARDYGGSQSRQITDDAMNDHDQDDALAALAFGRTKAEDPDQTLLHRDLSALPPFYLDCGLDEVLLDDSLRLARAAALAGVPVTTATRPGFHMIQLFAGRYEPGAKSLDRAGAWLRDPSFCLTRYRWRDTSLCLTAP